MNHLDKFMKTAAPKNYMPTVTQHNHLIRAEYDYTLREIKTARLIISKVNPMSDGGYPTDGFLVKIHPDEARAIYAEEGKKFNDVWGVFKRTTKSLNTKPLGMNSPLFEGDLYIVASVVRHKHEGHFYVRTNPDLSPFIVALNKGNFTTIPLRIYSRFNSKYLARLYEELYSNRSMRGGIKKYDDWKTLARFCGWKGEKYSHFKNRVLLEGKKRFPTFSPLSFEFEEIKKPGTKMVQGLICTITTIKPKADSKPTLFPEMSGSTKEIVNEIRQQLIAWSVNYLTIEKLIENPFQYIDNATLKEKVRKEYDKYAYLWEKMKYVAQAKNVQDEAKYLIVAIKNNYTSKAQEQEKSKAKRKAFDNERLAQLALAENHIKDIRNAAAILKADVTAAILDKDAELRDSIFARAARKSGYEHKTLGELKMLFYEPGGFRHEVIARVKEKFPSEFVQIEKGEQQQLLELERRKREIKTRKMIP